MKKKILLLLVAIFSLFCVIGGNMQNVSADPNDVPAVTSPNPQP
jgi:hypothetical protein